jgi:hypothetical protein
MVLSCQEIEGVFFFFFFFLNILWWLVDLNFKVMSEHYFDLVGSVPNLFTAYLYHQKFSAWEKLFDWLTV